MVTVHNLDSREVEVKLALDDVDQLRPLYSDHGDRAARKAASAIGLGPYGFGWFRARGERR